MMQNHDPRWQNSYPPYEPNHENPHSLRYEPVIVPVEKKKRPAPRFLATIALVLVCALAGFGGGMLALSRNSGQNTVFYKSVESPANVTGLSAGEGEPTLSDIAQNSSQSVVSITTENLVADFFTGGRIISGAGSGVILSEDGTIITNNHVVDGAREIKVTLANGEEYSASLVGSDETTDIAVLKIDADGLSPAVIGNSDKLKLGETCLAIGNPMGSFSGTVTDGIVSALDRELTIDGQPMELLQTNAAISPGNSGGGLFNARGELIGIVNAKEGSTQSEGIGFAIPVNTAIEVAEELITNGYVTGRPALGVSVAAYSTPEEAAYAGFSAPGVYLIQVQRGGAAAEAGLRAGDQILSIENQEIEDLATLSTALAPYSAGDKVSLRIQRGSEIITCELILQELAA